MQTTWTRYLEQAIEWTEQAERSDGNPFLALLATRKWRLALLHCLQAHGVDQSTDLPYEPLRQLTQAAERIKACVGFGEE